MRGRHRGAAGQAVRPAGDRAEDIDARSGDIDRRDPVVGEDGQLVVMIGGRDREDARQVVGGRIKRDQVVVEAGIAGGSHEQDPALDAGVDRRVHA